MKSNKKPAATVLSAFALLIQAALPPQALAGTKHAAEAQWSVEVDKVDAGDVNMEPAFGAAIYENLLDEVAKTKRFKQVFRSGDRNVAGHRDLLILKTTVQSYTPGSETKRVVTTVGGATKLKVLCQLSTPHGQVVLERSIDGNVRFFGDNLRATHNLAHNVAAAIKQSTLPAAASDSPQKSEPSAASPQP